MLFFEFTKDDFWLQQEVFFKWLMLEEIHLNKMLSYL